MPRRSAIPRVLISIRSLMTQSIAVTMMQWTGPRLQVQVVDWMLIKDEACERVRRGDRSRAAAVVRRRHLDQRRHRLFAPAAAAKSVQRERRVIDISGDGANNSGRPVTFRPATKRCATVSASTACRSSPIEPDLDRYYYDNVIGGPGAFMIPAENYESFADAF
jgi:hypothetical protein